MAPVKKNNDGYSWNRLMALDGRLERSEDVQHLIVHRMEN